MLENIPQIMGWLSNVLFIYGVYAIGKKHVSGFYSCVMANLLYVFQAIMMDNPSLLWLSILLILLNLKGIYEWQFKTKKNKFSNVLKKERKHADKVYRSSLAEYISSTESKR